MAEKLIGAAVIGQSGGPTSVINASAYGAISAALQAEEITQVLGADHGITGVLGDKLYDMGLEDPAELALLKNTPSSELGSCRYKLADPEVDDTDYKTILEVFKKHNVTPAQLHHCAISEGKSAAANFDVVLCARNFAKTFDDAKNKGTVVIPLKNIMSDKEMEAGLKEAGLLD